MNTCCHLYDKNTDTWSSVCICIVTNISQVNYITDLLFEGHLCSKDDQNEE